MLNRTFVHFMYICAKLKLYAIKTPPSASPKAFFINDIFSKNYYLYLHTESKIYHSAKLSVGGNYYRPHV